MKPPDADGSPGLSARTGLSEVSVQVFVILALLVALLVVTSLINPNFLLPITQRSLSRDAAILSLFALGQGIVIISGGIDLSVGSLLCFDGCVTILLVNHWHWNFLEASMLVLVMNACIGLIHGFLICLLDLPPFLVTLCSLLFFRGLSRVITSDSTVAFNIQEHPFFALLGEDAWLGVPTAVYVLLAVVVPVCFFMHFTVPGRYLFAIGSNLEAARFSGVPVNDLRIFSYVLCAVMTGIASFLEASSIGSITPSSAGIAYEMYGITAAVLGGCSLRGGEGSLFGIIIGAAILRVIRSAVIFTNLSTYWTYSVTGLVLLGAVVADAMVRRRRKKQVPSRLN